MDDKNELEVKVGEQANEMSDSVPAEQTETNAESGDDALDAVFEPDLPDEIEPPAKDVTEIPDKKPDMPEAPTEQVRTPEEKSTETGEKPTRVQPREKKKTIFLDATGKETPNYTGDEESERDYLPVRQSHEYRSGCLGGLMYFVFMLCVSVILAVFMWMAASDALALNKETTEVSITLPASAFETVTEDVLDDEGNVIDTQEVTYADIDYVADTLEAAGLVQYKWLFKFFCSVSHASTKIDAGTYQLKSSFDYRALVSNMQTNSNRAITVEVTIPEGYSMYDIFMKLEEEGVASFDDLMDAAANRSYNYPFLDDSSAGDASRLEGFLFPDTYEFYVGMQPSSAINKFLRNFNDKYTAEMQELAESRNLNTQEVITIASLIEKEAAVDIANGIDERTTVASVIYNRLRAGMSLGLESAILYIYPDYEGLPTAEMMATDTPYNLNLYAGLPPTPICNPSIASINAALNPASTRYYYFTLDTATGAHRFFTNYNDFMAFVATQNYGS